MPARTSPTTAGTRFQLPKAPAVFRDLIWEVEFSERGLQRLSFHEPSKKTSKQAASPLESRYKPPFKTLQQMLLDRLKGGQSEWPWEELDVAEAREFYRRVWRATRNIPFGETATYGDIAGDAGSPLAFRACGQACGACDISIFIPCHRVVSANGLGGFGSALEWKKRLLAMEKK